MKPLIAILLSFTMFSCAFYGPKTDLSNFQIALVYLGRQQGNGIRVPNIDRLLSYNFYRYSESDSIFHFMKNVKKPPLPLRFNFTQFGVEWIDKGNSSLKSQYKVMALNKEGKEFLELDLVVSVPDSLGKWVIIERPDYSNNSD